MLIRSLATLLCLLLLPISVWANDKVVTLVTGDNFAPFTGKELLYGGLATRIVNRAFEESGYFVKEIKWSPWNRAFASTFLGESDGSFPWGITPERQEKVTFSDPILSANIYPWVLNVNNKPNMVREDFIGKKICRPQGYAHFGLAKELWDKNLIKQETPMNMVSCFKMLLLDRVDFVVANYMDAINALNQLPGSLHKVARNKLIISDVQQRFIVGNENPNKEAIIKAFNSGLEKLKASGEYDIIKREFEFKE